MDQKKQIGLVGIPYDKKSSFLQGPALAPSAIRSVLHDGSANEYSELRVNTEGLYADLGDIEIQEYFDIQNGINTFLQKNYQIVALGGDHSVTYPIVKAYGELYKDFQILHFDAHADLYHEFEGDPFSNACPFARIMEDGLTKNLTQIGIRTLNQHQIEQAEKFNVRIIEAKDAENTVQLKPDLPVYISIDLDCLDPAFAPGVSHHAPGGLTSRQILDIIHSIDVPIIGADIVELNPHRDLFNMTAAVAAKLIKEVTGKIISNN